MFVPTLFTHASDLPALQPYVTSADIKCHHILCLTLNSSGKNKKTTHTHTHTNAYIQTPTDTIQSTFL